MKHSASSKVDVIISEQNKNEQYRLNTALPHLQIAGYHLSFYRSLIPRECSTASSLPKVHHFNI